MNTYSQDVIRFVRDAELARVEREERQRVIRGTINGVGISLLCWSGIIWWFVR